MFTPSFDDPAPARPDRGDLHAEWSQEGAQAERERCRLILTPHLGKATWPAALAMALDTDLSAEQALKLLGSMPAECAPARSTSPFAAAFPHLAAEGLDGLLARVSDRQKSMVER